MITAFFALLGLTCGFVGQAMFPDADGKVGFACGMSLYLTICCGLYVYDLYPVA